MAAAATPRHRRRRAGDNSFTFSSQGKTHIVPGPRPHGYDLISASAPSTPRNSSPNSPKPLANPFDRKPPQSGKKASRPGHSLLATLMFSDLGSDRPLWWPGR
jgi:hypothetical protein